MDPRAADPDVFLQAYFSIAAGGQGGRRLGVDLGSGKFLYEQSQFRVRILESVVYWLVLRWKSRGTGVTAIYIDRFDQDSSSAFNPSSVTPVLPFRAPFLSPPATAARRPAYPDALRALRLSADGPGPHPPVLRSLP